MADRKKPSAEHKFGKHIAKATLDDGLLRYSSDGRCLYEWTGSYWKPILDELDAIAWDWLTKNMKNRASPRASASCAGAAVLAASRLPLRGANNVEVLIPVHNGSLEISQHPTGEYSVALRPSRREDGNTFCLACSFEHMANYPKFSKFYEEVLPDDALRSVVQEYLGYTLLGDTRFQTAQFWYGSGSNGKGVLAEICMALHENPVAMQIDRLDGFKLAPMIGASLAYVDEIPPKIDEQKIKQLISGNFVQIDRKYRDSVSIKPTAKWIICGNSMPLVTDHSLGFWRRFQIIPFTTYITDDSIDPFLAKNIISDELSGVLNFAIDGLIRLLERGRFGPSPGLMLEAIESAKSESNSVLAWWNSSDQNKIDDSAEISKDDVYAKYSSWAKRNGIHPLASPIFWKRLNSIGKFTERQLTIGGRRGRYIGISIL